MSNPYIDSAVNKIINDTQLEFPLNLALASCWISAHFKGENLKICDARGKSSLADYFILMSSSNTTQAGAIATEISNQLKKHKANCLSKEGLDTSNWILLDFGDVIIHIFQEKAQAELCRNKIQQDNLEDKFKKLDIESRDRSADPGAWNRKINKEYREE